MSKRKGPRPRNPRSASKVRSKAARSRIAAHQQTRATSKQAQVRLRYCADQTAPRSPASCAPPGGSRT
jgi:hypothetical protein